MTEFIETNSDPRRCQAITKKGEQCNVVAEYGSDYCTRHRGNQQIKVQEQKRGFLLSKAKEQARLAEVANSLEPVKELRDSIALLHMLIEKRFDLIKDDELSLITACGPLTSMLQNMEKLISSCHKIEQNLGELLSKQTILELAQQMVAIIIDELEGIEGYEQIVDNITFRLMNTVQKAGSLKLGEA